MSGEAALEKIDNELGIAYICPNCHIFVCSSDYCDCGTLINLDLPKKQYFGKVRWDNYKLD